MEISMLNQTVVKSLNYWIRFAIYACSYSSYPILLRYSFSSLNLICVVASTMTPSMLLNAPEVDLNHYILSPTHIYVLFYQHCFMNSINSVYIYSMLSCDVICFLVHDWIDSLLLCTCVVSSVCMYDYILVFALTQCTACPYYSLLIYAIHFCHPYVIYPCLVFLYYMHVYVYPPCIFCLLIFSTYAHSPSTSPLVCLPILIYHCP